MRFRFTTHGFLNKKYRFLNQLEKDYIVKKYFVFSNSFEIELSIRKKSSIAIITNRNTLYNYLIDYGKFDNKFIDLRIEIQLICNKYLLLLFVYNKNGWTGYKF